MSPKVPQSDYEELIKAAERKLAGARHALTGGFCDDAASRAYYAAFHAISAVLAAKGLTFSSHSQTLGAFNREFIMTGEIPELRFRDIQRLFDDRQTGDYGPLPIDEKDATEDVKVALAILGACRAYLAST